MLECPVYADESRLWALTFKNLCLCAFVPTQKDLPLDYQLYWNNKISPPLKRYTSYILSLARALSFSPAPPPLSLHAHKLLTTSCIGTIRLSLPSSGCQFPKIWHCTRYLCCPLLRFVLHFATKKISRILRYVYCTLLLHRISILALPSRDCPFPRYLYCTRYSYCALLLRKKTLKTPLRTRFLEKPKKNLRTRFLRTRFLGLKPALTKMCVCVSLCVCVYAYIHTRVCV